MVGGGWRREMNESYVVSSYFIDVSQFFASLMSGVKQEFRLPMQKGWSVSRIQEWQRHRRVKGAR